MTGNRSPELDRLVGQPTLISSLQRSVRLDAAAVLDGPAPSRTLPRSAGRRDDHGMSAVDVVELPEDTLRFGLDTVLDVRESVRFYDEAEVDPAALVAVVRAGLESDRTGWPDDVDAGVAVELLVVARRVTGVEPGVYRLLDSRLVPLAPLADAGADELVLQIEYAWSPAILIALVPFAAALDRWGDHGERMANTRAAGAVTAALHAASSLGLVGSPFAGFLTAGLRRLLDVDGYADAQLFAASLGHPADEGSIPERPTGPSTAR